MMAAALAAPSSLLAQESAPAAPTAAPASLPPTAPAPVAAAPPAAQPAPPATFVPDPPPAVAAPAPAAPKGVENESQPNTTSASERERKRDRDRKRERERERDDADSGGGALGQTARDALPAIGPMNVPSFFIDTFAVPPFLLPIYQAAGIQYGVRWEILAAINEIETDYGRNLNVSTAGAMGWMQFMPATWEAYGVDANGDGRKDPYNPVDAIFAAARYLKAAGAERDLAAAIFAYNHADWYVTSVLKRAQLLAALPADLVGALSGLAQGRPPVIGRARVARHRANGSRTLLLSTRSQARVVAVTDGEIVAIGQSPRLGSFIRLRDTFGNTYTYGSLGTRARRYPVLDETDKVPAPRAPARDAPPTTAATAGAQLPATQGSPPPSMPAPAPTARGAAVRPARVQDPAAVAAVAPIRGAVPFAIAAGASTAPAVAASPRDSRQLALDGSRPRPVPARPAAPPAPALAVAWPQAPALARFDRLAADWTARRAATRATVTAKSPASGRASAYDERLLRDTTGKRVRYRPLRKGSRVVAGTVLARSGAAPSGAEGGRMRLEIRPAGRGAPRIDPRPIVAGWKLLNASQPTVDSEPSIGQILLLSKRALERRVLEDRRIRLYRCGREDVRAGRIDRRVLVTLELLAISNLRPTVSSLFCGHGRLTSSGNVSEHSIGNAVDISAINGVPIKGNQGPGSITETTIRRLLSLQGTVKPHQIISLMTFDGADNTLSMADHDDHIHVGFASEGARRSLAARQFDGVLKPRQWAALMNRLSRIDNPEVPKLPSHSATRTRAKPG